MPPFIAIGTQMLVTAVIVGLYVYWMPQPHAMKALLWIGATLGVLLGIAVVLALWSTARENRRLRLAADRHERIVRDLAVRHPGTRATALSRGRYLLTDLATGKTVGEVDAGEV